MGTEDVKVTAMNMYKYKERLRFYKRWPLAVNSHSGQSFGHEHVRIQNVRDFAQTKPDSEINAPFLSNEHGDPRFFFSGFC